MWPGFLVAGIHEGAACALGAEIGVVDGRARLTCGEAASQLRVGLEFGRTAVELARMAKEHSSAPVHGLNNAADLYVHVAVLAEFAYFIMVFPQAEDCKAAGVVRGLGFADVEVASAVGKLDYVVNVR